MYGIGETIDRETMTVDGMTFIFKDVLKWKTFLRYFEPFSY